MLHELRIRSSVVLMTITPDDLRLVSRSTISDTKWDTTTTTLLVTVLLPCTESAVDIWKIPGVLLYLPKLGDILCMCNSLYQATLLWPGCDAIYAVLSFHGLCYCLD